LVGCELLGAFFGGAYKEALAQFLCGAFECGGEDVLANAICFGGVFCYVEEHGGDGVGEAVGVLAGGVEVFSESRPGIGELYWGCVVG